MNCWLFQVGTGYTRVQLSALGEKLMKHAKVKHTLRKLSVILYIPYELCARICIDIEIDRV